MKHSRLALLTTTFLTLSGAAYAQTAADWSVTSGAVTITSTNNGTAPVQLDTNGATIGGLKIGEASGTPTTADKSSISMTAVGASASNSVTATANETVVADFTVGEMNITATNNATVDVGNLGGGTSLNVDIDSPVITGGNFNSISLTGVGASASSSLSALQNDAGTNASTITFNITGADNSITSNNNANVTVTGSLLGAIGGTGTGPEISTGLGNSISISALGASASNSLTSSVLGAGSDMSLSSDVTGPLSISATNNATVTLDASSNGIDTATIGGGTSNSISLAGIGASASSSVKSTASGDTTSSANVTFNVSGLTTLEATNDAGSAVSVSGNIADAKIDGGSFNTISITGVGASASNSLSSTSTGGTTSVNSALTGGLTAIATNNSSVTVTANVNNAQIAGGVGNGISTTAIGSSASQSYNIIIQ